MGKKRMVHHVLKQGMFARKRAEPAGEIERKKWHNAASTQWYTDIGYTQTVLAQRDNLFDSFRIVDHGTKRTNDSQSMIPKAG